MLFGKAKPPDLVQVREGVLLPWCEAPAGKGNLVRRQQTRNGARIFARIFARILARKTDPERRTDFGTDFGTDFDTDFSGRISFFGKGIRGVAGRAAGGAFWGWFGGALEWHVWGSGGVGGSGMGSGIRAVGAGGGLGVVHGRW